MSNQRNPKRDESKKIYLESRGKLKPKEIAEQLGVSPGLIRKWKSVDKWDDELNGNVTPESNSNGNVPPQRKRQNYQAPKDNQYAKGNKGNTTPNNKNALKHGLYESISFDFLNKDEKEMVVDMLSNEYDPLTNINETIVELRIRQRRMMRRIQVLEEDLNDVEKDTLSIQRLRKSEDEIDIDVVEGHIIEIPKYALKEVERHETSYRKITDILAIEEALTRVTDSLLRAIKTRNDIEESLDYKRPSQLLKNKKLEKELEMFDADDNDDEPLRIEIISKSSRDGG